MPTSSSKACITVPGGYTVTVRGSTNVATGLTLGSSGGFFETLEVSGSTDAGDATLTLLSQGTASGGIRDSGQLVLTSTDANTAATVDVAGGTLYNEGGRITVASGGGAGGSGGRFWHGAIQQRSHAHVSIAPSNGARSRQAGARGGAYRPALYECSGGDPGRGGCRTRQQQHPIIQCRRSRDIRRSLSLERPGCAYHD